MNNSIPDFKVSSITSDSPVPKFVQIETTKNLRFNNLVLKTDKLQSNRLYERAVQLYERMLIMVPRSLNPKINLSGCLIKLNMNERALQVLNQAEALDPKNDYIHYNKAVALYYLNQKKQALQSIENGIASNNSLEFKELKEIIENSSLNHVQSADSTIFRKKKNSHSLHQLKTKTPKLLNLKINKVPSFDFKSDPLPPISNEPSLKSTKLTYEEILSKTNFLNNLLSERESRMSMISNTPRPKKTPNISTNFFQENLVEAISPRTLIKVSPELSSESEVNVKKTSLDAIITKKLSKQSVEYVLQEYQKPRDKRDYDKLIENFSRLPFFAKFPKGIQRLLLETASLITYGPGDIIINQGDIGECMFVILNGSVNIHRQAAEYRNLDIIVNSMYDGEAFGELALLSNPNESDIRRTASCIAAETTSVISISKSDYTHILIEKMHNDIIDRIKFIKSLQFFIDQPWISLVPFVSGLEPKVYKVGEVILEQGEYPPGMFIIYVGRCKVYWEGYVKKTNPNRRYPLKPFFTGKSTPYVQTPRKLPFKLTEPTEKIFYSQFKKHLKNNESLKAAEYFKTSFIDPESVKKERLECIVLKEGDYFSGRAVLDSGVLEPSKFTIISESKEVKVFIITNKSLNYLDEDCSVILN
jgi:CRP-like cAMP-binding protein/tetratricopeptide (TPR) repeat protein